MGKHYRFKGVGLDKEEAKRANKLFNEYKDNYNINNFSDIQLLEDLVYREIKQDSYKRKLEEINRNIKEAQKDGGKETLANIVPKAVLSAFDDNLTQILILKEKLGLFREKTEDEYKAFQILEKKFETWEKNHAEERKVTCPFCSQLFFLHIKTDKYKESGLKLFKNKVLCNESLWKIYKEKKITKQEFAEILNVSTDYIDFLEKKIYNKPSK